MSSFEAGGAYQDAWELAEEDAWASDQADAEIADDADSSADAVSADADETHQTDRLNAEATTPISAEIKDSIVEQVKQELSHDSVASNAHVEKTGYDEVSSVFSRPNQVFIVSSSLEVSVDEQVCGLQPGDILKLTSASTWKLAWANCRRVKDGTASLLHPRAWLLRHGPISLTNRQSPLAR